MKDKKPAWKIDRDRSTVWPGRAIVCFNRDITAPQPSTASVGDYLCDKALEEFKSGPEHSSFAAAKDKIATLDRELEEAEQRVSDYQSELACALVVGDTEQAEAGLASAMDRVKSLELLREGVKGLLAELRQSAAFAYEQFKREWSDRSKRDSDPKIEDVFARINAAISDLLCEYQALLHQRFLSDRQAKSLPSVDELLGPDSATSQGAKSAPGPMGFYPFKAEAADEQPRTVLDPRPDYSSALAPRVPKPGDGVMIPAEGGN